MTAPEPVPWDQRIALSLAETAPLISVSKRTLQRWVSTGTCPIPYRQLGRRRVFAVTEIKAWLELEAVA